MKKEPNKKSFPPEYRKDNYPYDLRNCPGYEGYIPKNLGHEVCGNCGAIHYYH